MTNTPRISVLMSVFNETEKVFRESVSSILNQTFDDFEFIIVCDKVERKEEIEAILTEYNDNRIVYLVNEKNIGLAMSMNKALQIARADIVARMDADDIAKPKRFEKEYDVLKTGSYDFVFSSYEDIKDDSVIINQEYTQAFPHYSSEEISKVLQYRNMIHHPTVMILKSVIDKVGGYRDFPVSQDFDLWLRLNENSCRFYMIDEPLLLYRVNANGTSRRKWLQQQLTIHYIFELSCQRLRKGKDNFSLENYQAYLEKNEYTDEQKASDLRKSERLLVDALKERKKGNLLKSLRLRTSVFASNSILRRYYINVLKKRILLKLK